MVKIEDLTFGYRNKQQLFSGLNLNLPMSHIYGLLGKNGAGKTSLLKLMAGLLFPKEGNIEIGGYRPADRNPDYLKEVFLVTEEIHLPEMSLAKYVRLYSVFYPRFNHDLLQSYLTEFKLPSDKNLSSLSYGQKKKFLLSFGLATDCQLLILDEPTNGLDIPSKSQFRKIVASAINHNRLIIISTHQARDMENLIDPIIILDEGKVIFFEDYESIARHLKVSKYRDFEAHEGVVYSESSLSGHVVVEENRTEEESRMNLELLFNAVISNGDKVNEIFKKHKDEVNAGV